MQYRLGTDVDTGAGGTLGVRPGDGHDRSGCGRLELLT